MKILIVCSNGLSTNILCHQLQNYAIEKQSNDLFEACGIGRYQEYDDIDVICIAPQICFMKDDILAYAKQYHITVFLLDEKDISFMDVQIIYEKIHNLVIEEKQEVILSKKYDYKNKRYFLAFPILLYSLFIWVCQSMDICFSSYLFSKPIIIFIYYYAIILAVVLGSDKKINERMATLISFTITSLMMSCSNYNYLFYESDYSTHFISFRFYGLLLILSVCIYLGVVIYRFGFNYIQKKNQKVLINNYNELISCIPLTFVIFFTLIFRQLFELF